MRAAPVIAAPTTWLDRMRTEADRLTQRVLAAQLGVSPTLLNRALLGKYTSDLGRLQTAFEGAYGNSVDWLGALRAEVERSSQVRAAQRIGLSPATVSQVLSGQYKADAQRIARRVRGALLGETVECPVALEMPLHICQGIQDRRAGKFGNPVWARAQLCCKGLGEFSGAGPCSHACAPASTSTYAVPTPQPQSQPMEKQS